MTFAEAHTLIKKADVIAVRRELNTGLDVDLANRFGWTLLMLCALEWNVSIGKLLISKGAAPDKTNRFGETALALAALKGHLPFVRLMIGVRASTSCRPHGVSLEEYVGQRSGLSSRKTKSLLNMIKPPA